MNHAASLMERYSARVYHVAARSLDEAGSKHAIPFTSGSPNRTRPFTRGGGASPPMVGTLDDRLVSRAKPLSSIRWPPDRLSWSELSKPSSSLMGSGAFAAESCPVCLEDFGPDRRARGLGCGHGFCQPCLDRWLESNNTCPVCRAPTSSAAVPARPPDAMDEVRFRLDRIQRRYPSVLERRVLDGIVRRGFRGPLARDPAVVSRRSSTDG